MSTTDVLLLPDMGRTTLFLGQTQEKQGSMKGFVIDKDTEEFIYSSICTFCIHHFTGGKKHTCKAFPEGIPRKIWEGENDHKNPFPGDHGIRFEPK